MEVPPNSGALESSSAEIEGTAQPPDTSPPTVHSTVHPSEEIEHAYWAEYEEDTTVPDEDELKEINGGDSDYSAYDHKYWEANFFRELGDPEYVPTEKARLTWTFKGVRGTPENPNRHKIMRSPAAFVGGYWWRIKFYPRGNNVNALSVYLECSATMPTPDNDLPQMEFSVRRGTPDASLDDNAPEVDLKTEATCEPTAWLEGYKSQYSVARNAAQSVDNETSASWRVPAQVGVIVYNPQEPHTGWMQSSCHQFNPHNLDWGWTYFHGPWDQIHSRRRGQHRALLNDDTLSFDVYIRVVDDPTNSLWWHPSDSEPTWDSMALTGYRPLGDSIINHSPEVAGLASWLHIAPFRTIIQDVDIFEHLNNVDAKPKPLCEALQRLIWQLYRQAPSLGYVDTGAVTQTLRNLNEFSSDVSEFWERLRRTLELELEGTEAGKRFAQLFDSPIINPSSVNGHATVNVLPTDVNSHLYMSVDQAKSSSEAVTTYLNTRSGPWSLPPVLHVEFGRHTLDKGKRWELRYDKTQLDEELDLSPWVLDGQSSKYVLYGYIVHRGRRTSGKFFSILRPAGPGTTWLAFDDGSDNRVECLTQKTAMGPHLGLDASQNVDHTKGHDVPVVAMYVRGDMVAELLPGSQASWEAPEPLKHYFETGVYHVADKLADDVPIEIYSLPQYDLLGSLFDPHDLIAHTKATGSVMYLNLPRTTHLVELRRRIALGKSSVFRATSPERIRLWQISNPLAQSGSSLTLETVVDLDVPLGSSLNPIRFWMEVLSEEDAQFFAVPNPPLLVTSGGKAPDHLVDGLRPEASENSTSSVVEGDAVASSSGNAFQGATAPSLSSNVTPDDRTVSQLARISSDTDDETTGRVENAVYPQAEASTEALSSAPLASFGARSSTEPATVHTDPGLNLPIGHAYYFIQMFDLDTQEFRTIGSFFSKLDANVKASIRRHLKRPMRQDFLIWKRFERATVATVSPADSFNDVVAPHGACFIVGDKLTKEKRSELASSGLFSNPNHLAQYLWAKSRGHPIQSFTGRKTIEATFTNGYYSGDFVNGHHHGQGTHISGSGMVYEGDFVCGRRHGQGTLVYPTGDTYDGDWIEDVCHGQGTYIEKSTGNKYVGGFKYGKRHGKGISYLEVADAELEFCQICYTEEMNAVFADCGHLCSCVTCANLVGLCPMCRKEVKKVIKIYRA